jgi:hypothetical protein
VHLLLVEGKKTVARVDEGDLLRRDAAFGTVLGVLGVVV